ncbi:asparagine synthase (glutamine-hydrolyzing) [bacterium]|nr:asparagine synthase (glutamine-hydrolyzing) [bacterium]
MCGICGVTFSDQASSVSRNSLKRMTDAIRHRGPDDEGWVLKGNCGLGMRRLSIIDLAGGYQPIANEDGSVWIVFNGEIYNHIELREELIKKGHTFRTLSDTEAILHAYEEYGEDCPKKLNGMFAFAIWDQNKRMLFLARDRLGIKPLYYYHDAKQFVFGSELKSILQVDSVPREIDPIALDVYLTVEYIPAPYTIFKSIAKLLPGHYLILKDGKAKIGKYWQLDFQEYDHSKGEIIEQLLSLLQDAVRVRLMSDVPLGALLSGGIDSSAIVALMSRVMDRPVQTFSIGFKEATYNESQHARTIAEHFKTEHHESVIEANALDLTERLVGHLDEPFGDFSIFPTYLVSKMAREQVTVALSGDGGDELFAGYDTYVANRIGKAYGRFPKVIRHTFLENLLDRVPPTEKKKGLINRAKRFVEGMRLPEDLQHTRWMIFLQEAEKAELYSADLQTALTGHDSYGFIRRYFGETRTSDELNRQLYVDIKTYLVDDILVKVDRMSMATSLETRVPFLDHRLVEFTATIPGRHKLKGKSTKHILKQSLKNILPSEILQRGKEGFSIPIKNWLKDDLKPIMLDILDPSVVRRQGFFDPEFVQRLTNEHLTDVENHSHRLWAMMVFGIWQDIYLSKPSHVNEESVVEERELTEV